MKLRNPLALALAASLTTACSLAPGIHIKDAEVTERAHEQQGDDQFKIQVVSPYLIQKFAKEHQAEVAARKPDPNVLLFKDYQYRIAPHDILSVIVWDHPELTSPTGQYRSPEENGQVVYADGTMFYPFVGYITVAGKTVIEIQRELTSRLKHAIKDPQVAVRVARFLGRRVEITGEVKQPQTLFLDNVPIRVSDALVRTGGFSQASNPAEVTLIRGGKATVLDLMSFYEEGDPKQNWLLMDGDTVHVGSMTLSQVFVFGEVKTMGTRPCSAGASRSRRRSATAPASTTPPCAPPCTSSARSPRASRRSSGSTWPRPTRSSWRPSSRSSPGTWSSWPRTTWPA